MLFRQHVFAAEAKNAAVEITAAEWFFAIVDGSIQHFICSVLAVLWRMLYLIAHLSDAAATAVPASAANWLEGEGNFIIAVIGRIAMENLSSIVPADGSIF